MKLERKKQLMLFTALSSKVKMELRRLFRFIYLNIYAFLLLLMGLCLTGIPLFKITVFLCIPQIIIIIILFQNSYRLFSSWEDKKRMYALLMEKNRKGFSAETFKMYMKAPCGRVLTKAVLHDIGLKYKYKELLAYKEPLLVSIKNNFIPMETKIYINEGIL